MGGGTASVMKPWTGEYMACSLARFSGRMANDRLLDSRFLAGVLMRLFCLPLFLSNLYFGLSLGSCWS